MHFIYSQYQNLDEFYSTFVHRAKVQKYKHCHNYILKENTYQENCLNKNSKINANQAIFKTQPPETFQLIMHPAESNEQRTALKKAFPQIIYFNSQN